MRQPQQHPPRQCLLLRCELLEDLIGPGRDSAADAAAVAVALQSQHPTMLPLPELVQRVLQQRQSAGVPAHIGQDGGDQSRLEAQPLAEGRLLDGRREPFSCQRADQQLMARHLLGQRRILGDAGVEIGPHGDDHQAAPVWFGCRQQQIEKGLPLRLIPAEGEQLFKLIDDQHQRGGAGSAPEQGTGFQTQGEGRAT